MDATSDLKPSNDTGTGLFEQYGFRFIQTNRAGVDVSYFVACVSLFRYRFCVSNGKISFFR